MLLDTGEWGGDNEIQEYTGKYRDRLVAAGMASAAKELIQETIAFVEANRTSKAGPAAWDQLLVSLREESTN